MNLLFEYIQGLFSKGRSDLLIAIGVILIILMMIIPMPTVLLDLFMTINILLSILIILNVLYIRSALEFSVFPSILLISTIFSLALNISSTRLILTQGETFSGTIVRAFGNFVVGTSGPEGLIVGVIIFIIIIAVQFVVITKGASRVAEVSARFTLDALPGKQMSIEAEFNSGAITEEELILRRRELQQEVDFYGSMDGASKFVSGNVKAGIFITFINIVGGMIVGVLIRNENVGSALTNYVQLTIGDGLVSQLPALLISTASGIIVTRAVSQGNIGEEVSREFSNYVRIYYLAGALLCLLAFLPGFPWYILFPLGVLLIIGARFSESKKTIKAIDEEKRLAEEEKRESQKEVPKLEPLDPIALEIGYDLVPLVQDDEGKAELLNRISSIRREIGVKYGIVIPLMRIIDNYLLSSSAYSVKLNGVEIGKGNIMINKLLAIQGQQRDNQEQIDGEKTYDPAFGLPAVWIQPTDRAKAERSGYTVADPTSVISTHISTLIEQHAAELLSRQDVSSMIEQYKTSHPVTVEELRKHLEISHIQHVFRRLLKERVSLRNLTDLFETLSDYGAVTKDIDFLVEKSRQTLARQISGQYADEKGVIYAYTLDHKIERMIAGIYNEHSDGGTNMLPLEIRDMILHAIGNNVKPVTITEKNEYGDEVQEIKSVVLVTSELARPLIQKLLSMSINKLQYNIPILSMLDISEEHRLENVGVIEIDEVGQNEGDIA